MNGILNKPGVLFSLCCQGVLLLSGIIYAFNPRSLIAGALLGLGMVGYPLGAAVLGWNYCERRGAGGWWPAFRTGFSQGVAAGLAALPSLGLFYLYSMLLAPSTEGVAVAGIMVLLLLVSTFLGGLGGLLANLAVVIGYVEPAAGGPYPEEGEPPAA